MSQPKCPPKEPRHSHGQRGARKPTDEPGRYSTPLQVPVPETTRWQPLQHWFWHWFKENAGEHNEALAGAVHFLSDPEVSDGAVTFAVDLGTAPVEAFEDLLDALETMGARRCEIGHLEG